MQNKTTLTSYSLSYDNFFYKGQQIQHVNDIIYKRFLPNIYDYKKRPTKFTKHLASPHSNQGHVTHFIF